MPYRFAPIYLAVMLILSGIAFWPNYLSVLGSASWSHHLHGITATLWMVLMAVQAMLIHRRKPALHRTCGLATLALVPPFMAGGLIVIQTLLRSRADFAQAYGEKIAAIDFVLMLAFAGFCYAALAARRHVGLHGGYLLVTPLLLTESILTRIITGHEALTAMLPTEDPVAQFDWAMGLSQAVAIALGLVAARHYRRHRAPFVAIAAISALAWAAYALLGTAGFWTAWMAHYQALSHAVVGGIGFAIGLLAVGVGWRAGARPRATAI